MQLAADQPLCAEAILPLMFNNSVATVAAIYHVFKNVLLCRSGRGRKLSGDQITLPTTVDFSSSVPKQVSIGSVNTLALKCLKRQTTDLISNRTCMYLLCVHKRLL